LPKPLLFWGVPLPPDDAISTPLFSANQARGTFSARTAPTDRRNESDDADDDEQFDQRERGGSGRLLKCNVNESCRRLSPDGGLTISLHMTSRLPVRRRLAAAPC